MKKIISLVIIGMLSIGMVGCGKDYVLQEQIDIFESINIKSEDVYSVDEYCDIYREMGFKVEKHSDYIHCEIIIDEDIYHQFQKDVREIGIRKAREKYGIDELIKNVVIVNLEQKEILNELDEDVSLYFIITTDGYCDKHLSSMISVYDGKLETDAFKIK